MADQASISGLAWLLDGEKGQPIRELPIVPETDTPETSAVTGRITVPLPLGEGYLLLRFEDTQPRIVGKITSQTTAGILILLSLLFWWRGRRLPPSV